MALSEPALRAAAREAYEVGRWRHALVATWLAPAWALSSWTVSNDLVWHFGAGVLLIGVSWVLVWRGGDAGRAVQPALIAGSVPLVLPVLTMRAACSFESCSALCMAACLVGGAVAGVWFGVRAGSAKGKEYLAAGAIVAGLTGSLGCLAVGMSGVLGMVGAFAATAAPMTLGRSV